MMSARSSLENRAGHPSVQTAEHSYTNRHSSKRFGLSSGFLALVRASATAVLG